MQLSKAELREWALSTAREILNKLRWDYDPDKDVKKIAEVIEQQMPFRNTPKCSPYHLRSSWYGAVLSG